jgi:hypothetical protein
MMLQPVGDLSFCSPLPGLGESCNPLTCDCVDGLMCNEDGVCVEFDPGGRYAR